MRLGLQNAPFKKFGLAKSLFKTTKLIQMVVSLAQEINSVYFCGECTTTMLCMGSGLGRHGQFQTINCPWKIRPLTQESKSTNLGTDEQNKAKRIKQT